MRQLFVLPALSVLVLLSMAAVASPLPVKDWVRFPQIESVTISPDGSYLAVFSSPKDSDRYQLVVFRTKNLLAGKPKIMAHFSLREYKKFAGVRWVSNKRLIAWTARQVGGFDRPFFDGNLYAVNANGALLKHLMGTRGGGELGYKTSGTNRMVYFGGLLSLLPNDPNIIMVEGWPPGSNKPSAYRLDTVSGFFARTVGGLYEGGMLADHDGVVRIQWGTNEETGEPLLQYRAQHSMEWRNISPLIIKNRLAAAALALGTPIMFGPDNKLFYYEAWSGEPASTTGLYEFDPKTGKSTLVYANSKVDVGIGMFPIADPFIKSFNLRSLVGLRIMPGKVETLALNPGASRIRLLAALSRALPNGNVQITSATRNGEEAIVATLGDVQSPTFYLYASEPKPSLTPLFQESPWIKPDDLSPMKPITYRARDGLTIHGYLTIPRGLKPRNLPLVVYVHGGPHGVRYDWGFDPTDFDSVATQILANHGYAVLAPNYRGSGGYGFKFEAAGFRHWGDAMQNDLADAVNWAVAQGIADPKRVCILGGSYGGYAALMSAERFPNLFRCAVGYDGVYDLSLQETRDAIASRYAAGKLYLGTVLGHNEKLLKAFSPAFHANSLKAAVFLLHGGEDHIAPVKGYDEMVAAIRKHGTPLKTLFEPREGHGFYKPVHREKAWIAILAFLKQYIGPGVLAVHSTNATASN